MVKAASLLLCMLLIFHTGAQAALPAVEPRLPPPVLLSPNPGAYAAPGPVTLRWSAVEGAGAYRLVVEKDGTYESQEITVSGTEYTLSGLADGFRYPWTVFALHPSRIDLNSDNAPFRHFILSDHPIPPAAPRILTAADGADHARVRVSWSSALDADTYQVQRAGMDGGPVTDLGSTDGFEFLDETAEVGIRYRYGVRACNADGCSPLAEDEGWAGACSAPGRVALASPADGSQVRYNLDTGEVWLEWQPVTGVTAYQVTLTDALTGELRIDTTADQPTLRVQYQVGALAWQVRALDPVAGCPPGVWSETWTYTAAQNPPPAAPLDVQASDGTGAAWVTITWSQPPSETEPTDFHILRAESRFGTRSEIDFTGKLYYVDATVTPGTRYYYWIQACHVARGCSTSQPDSGFAGPAPLLPEAPPPVFLPLIVFSP